MPGQYEVDWFALLAVQDFTCRRVKRGIEVTAILYTCPADFWTIGYSHFCDPKRPPITEAKAEACLTRNLQTALAATPRYRPVLTTEPEGRVVTIANFTLNLGAEQLQTPTLRRQVNQRDWSAAATELC